MSKVTLLPCPFCGGCAVQRSREEYNRHWVKCEVCGACPGGEVPEMATAIARWNGRCPCTLGVTSPPPAERMEVDNPSKP